MTRDAATRVSIDARRGTVDVDAVTAVWDEALRVPARVGPPVWLHGDLSPGNVLCVDVRLHGVIHFGMLGAGDPACDLLVAWNVLDASTRDAFRAALGVDDDTWARGRAPALSVALVQLPYYGDTNPTLAASSRYVIGEVLADCA